MNFLLGDESSVGFLRDRSHASTIGTQFLQEFCHWRAGLQLFALRLDTGLWLFLVAFGAI
jgi:hypothetical protein